MKKVFLPLCLLAASCAAFAQNKPASSSKLQTPALRNFTDSLSYAIGISVGEFYKGMGVANMNTAVLGNAIQKVFANDSTRWNEEQVQNFLMGASQKVTEAQVNENKRAGMPFLPIIKPRPAS